jgi:3-oxoacid CoA-transferase subunit A
MVKFYTSSEEAIFDVKDGATNLVGGFGLTGIPENLLKATHKKGIMDLNIVSNTAHTDKHGLGPIFEKKQIKSFLASYIGENPIAEKQYFNNEFNLELVPQGTIAERLRAKSAGIPAFYLAVGVGTEVADGKEVRIIDGKEYILEEALGGDFAFVKAWKADREGNVVYRKTARNFNPVMASAAKITIVEVEEIVENGELDPDFIHTPSIYVNRIIHGENFEKPIEFLVTQD